MHPGLFKHFAQRTLLKGLVEFELALGERPIAARFAINAGDFNAPTRNETGHDATGRSNEILRRVPWYDQFATQEVHAANAK